MSLQNTSYSWSYFLISHWWRRSFAILRIVDWWFINDVSGLRTGSIFKGQAVQEDGTDGLSRNVARKLPFCAAKNPKRWELPCTPRRKPEITRGDSSCGFVFRCSDWTAICRPHCDTAYPEYINSQQCTTLSVMYFNNTFLTNMFRWLLRPSSGWNYYNNTKVQCDKKPGWRSRYSDSLRAGRSGDRIPVGRDFRHLSIPAPGLTQLPVQWVPCLSRG
jgi:hypothetical protein